LNNLEKLKKVKDFLENSEITKKFFQGYWEKAIDIIKFIERDINRAMNDEEIPNLKSKTNDLTEFLSVIKQDIFNRDISQLQDWLRDLLYFVHNYNNNITKNELIQQEIDNIIKLLNIYGSMNWLLKVTKELMHRYEQINKTEPYNIQLSRHYLETLLED